MSFDLAVLVLLAATMHASWNALVKGGRDPLAVQTAIFAIPAVVAAVLIPFIPIPDSSSWPFLAVSVIVHLFYYTALALGYRFGDLSLVYPIARGVAPVLVTALALVLENEVPSPLQLVGVALVSLGILSLGARRAGVTHETRAITYALLTGICIAIYTVADGMGVRRAAGPLGYIAWLFLLQGVAFFILTLAWRRRALLSAIAGEWQRNLFGGIIAMLSYAIVIWVMSVGALAPISALRESSVIIAAILGTTFLGEPFGRTRIVAAIIVCTGAALLTLAA